MCAHCQINVCIVWCFCVIGLERTTVNAGSNCTQGRFCRCCFVAGVFRKQAHPNKWACYTLSVRCSHRSSVVARSLGVDHLGPPKISTQFSSGPYIQLDGRRSVPHSTLVTYHRDRYFSLYLNGLIEECFGLLPAFRPKLSRIFVWIAFSWLVSQQIGPATKPIVVWKFRACPLPRLSRCLGRTRSGQQHDGWPWHRRRRCEPRIRLLERVGQKPTVGDRSPQLHLLRTKHCSGRRAEFTWSNID